MTVQLFSACGSLPTTNVNPCIKNSLLSNPCTSDVHSCIGKYQSSISYGVYAVCRQIIGTHTRVVSPFRLGMREALVVPILLWHSTEELCFSERERRCNCFPLADRFQRQMSILVLRTVYSVLLAPLMFIAVMFAEHNSVYSFYDVGSRL